MQNPHMVPRGPTAVLTLGLAIALVAILLAGGLMVARVAKLLTLGHVVALVAILPVGIQEAQL